MTSETCPALSQRTKRNTVALSLGASGKNIPASVGVTVIHEITSGLSEMSDTDSGLL